MTAFFLETFTDLTRYPKNLEPHKRLVRKFASDLFSFLSLSETDKPQIDFEEFLFCDKNIVSRYIMGLRILRRLFAMHHGAKVVRCCPQCITVCNDLTRISSLLVYNASWDRKFAVVVCDAPWG